jgi:hypothetical protein
LHQRLRRSLAVIGLALAAPAAAEAQIVVACDFDIADDLGRFTFGNTIHLVGSAGAGTSAGQFYLINANTAEGDVDLDGYAPSGCNYTSLYIAAITNLVNVENPALAIPSQNVVITNLPRDLASGQSAQVTVSVQLPPGTVAGRYVGRIEVRDNLIFAIPSPTRDLLNVDVISVEVLVNETFGLGFVDPDEDVELDSVVIRARAGQRASGVFRVANEGNTNLSDVRFSATDLRSESAVGLVIPAENISFSAPSFSSIGVGDTARVTVTVDVPRGLLSGRYRGEILAQGQDALAERIPLIVIVQSFRGILFTNNPVRSSFGDIGRIAFNGDPGTTYKIGIFDMSGLLVWADQGTVFAGSGGTPTAPGAGADFAVAYIWPLSNGRGEQVASGVYLVVVESIVSGQRQLAKDRLMVIR